MYFNMEKKLLEMKSFGVLFFWFAIVLASSYGHPADNSADNADQEGNNAAESGWKVRHKPRNVLEIILQIHSYNAKHKKSYSLRSNDKSNEHVVTAHDGRQAKNSGSEKPQVNRNVD